MHTHMHTLTPAHTHTCTHSHLHTLTHAQIHIKFSWHDAFQKGGFFGGEKKASKFVSISVLWTSLLHGCLTLLSSLSVHLFSPFLPLLSLFFSLSPSLLPSSLLLSLPPTGQVSATYERCCVLFNIGSLQSQIGKSQNFDSDDGLKNAAKYFQVR